MKYYVVEGRLRVRGVVKAGSEKMARKTWLARLKATAKKQSTPQIIVTTDNDAIFIEAAEIPAMR